LGNETIYKRHYINDKFTTNLLKYLPNCLKLDDFTPDKYFQEWHIYRTWNEHKNIANKSQVVLPPELIKNALLISESAFSNFALYMIAIKILRQYILYYTKAKWNYLCLANKFHVGRFILHFLIITTVFNKSLFHIYFDEFIFRNNSIRYYVSSYLLTLNMMVLVLIGIFGSTISRRPFLTRYVSERMNFLNRVSSKWRPETSTWILPSVTGLPSR
jgi:hypothetical protein